MNVSELAKDVFYVGVGAAVLGVQKLQVQRVEVAEKLGSLESQLCGVETRLEAMVDKLQASLPSQAATMVQQARDAGKAAREQARTLLPR